MDNVKTNRPAIFVSATSGEFRSFRIAVKRQLERKGVLMIVQDDFPTDYGEVREMLAARMREADAVICLVGFAYGAEPRQQPVDQRRRSYTQMEYDLARELLKPLYVFLSDEKAHPCDNQPIEDAECRRLQLDHRAALSGGDQLWHSFADQEQLQTLVARIRMTPSSAPQLSSGRLGQSAERLFGREDELERLDAAWVDPGTRVLSIVAWGGVGKTSLINGWMAQVAEDDWRFAEKVFDWSFFNQGTREQAAASADTFLAAALDFFDDGIPAGGGSSPWEKGERLAHLIGKKRSLLVLDGLEPLQHPPGALAGQLKEPALVALLRGLAQRNPGLCIVTTRERLTDLDPFRETTAPEWVLQHLSIAAGVSMLEALGVHGAEKEIRHVVERVAGHALTLNLLGRYLAKAHQGDIRRYDRLSFERADAKIQGGHAFKTIAAYEKWFADSGEDGVCALAILRLLGLFDRPADDACLNALFQKPVIPDLTDSLVDLDEEDRNLAISSLRECGLVWCGPESVDDGVRPMNDIQIDTHPLIREYFASQLRKQNPGGWREGHRRLYEYLQASAPYQPEGIQGLQPLYQAVMHGCRAGLHQEVCDNIYFRRILRGAEHYSWKLGAFGAELAALACFFEKPWDQPVAELNENTPSWLLNEVAVVLGAMSRVSEAVEPMRTLLGSDVRLESWADATISAGNLSELEVTLGDLDAAVKHGEQAVAFADHSGSGTEQMTTRAILADALYQAGRVEAWACFRETELKQEQLQPQYPRLYSGRGFRYCELLLSEAERVAWQQVLNLAVKAEDADVEKAAVEVKGRAEQSLIWDIPFDRPIDIAFHHLTLARASLYQLILKKNSRGFGESISDADITPTLAAIDEHLSKTVSSFRVGGDMGQVPRGYLTRSWLRFVQGDMDGAQGDLTEARNISARGPMRLFMADIHLYRARLFHAVKPYPWDKNPDGTERGPKDDLKDARKLIEKCGYWRRKEELEDAEEAAKNW